MYVVTVSPVQSYKSIPPCPRRSSCWPPTSTRSACRSPGRSSTSRGAPPPAGARTTSAPRGSTRSHTRHALLLSLQVVMKAVELPVVEQEACQAGLRRTRLGRRFRLHQSFLCAGGEVWDSWKLLLVETPSRWAWTPVQGTAEDPSYAPPMMAMFRWLLAHLNMFLLSLV